MTTAAPHTPAEAAFAFGPFLLHPRQKLLLEGPRPVRIGSRAMELLTALLERQGQVVSRDELVARVWPSTVVEETSLRVHISALRKTLGDGHNGARYLANVPGRGYSFVGEVQLLAPTASGRGAAAMPPRDHPHHNLPPRLTRQIGRADVMATLCSLLEQQRLVSVVGPGGMGKTTMALAIAESRLGVDRDGVCFVDLCPLIDPSRVLPALGGALGLSLPPNEPWAAVRAHLRDKQLLIVLDNCEHVIGAAAALVDQTLRACPGIRFIVTSREPLDTEGEWVHRLAALPSPADGSGVKVDDAARYPAVQLFVERAAANNDGFELTLETLEPVLKICRRLDGIPLAIELAAARVDGLGVHGLAANLDDLFTLLTRGRRTAYPRHKTLLAVLDWSYKLLNEVERAVLRRLSIFRSSFSLDSAAAVVASEDINAGAVIDAVLSLTAKSLVTIDAVDDDAVGHRLLYITHAYATRLLKQSEPGRDLPRRHAAHFRDMLAAVEVQQTSCTSHRLLKGALSSIDDIRAAVAWSLGEDGDLLIGLSLTAAARQVILDLGILDDYLGHVEQALARARQLSPPQPDVEMKLTIALSFLSGHTEGGRSLLPTIIPRAIELSMSAGTPEDRLEALFAACVGCFGQGDHLGSMENVRPIRALATGKLEAASVLLADRMEAMNAHYLGDHDHAAALAQQVLNYRTGSLSPRFSSHVPTGVSMRILLARIAWIQGRVDEAAELAGTALALSANTHPFSVCQALGLGAIPVAFWRGEADKAQALIARLSDFVKPAGLGYYRSWAWHCERAWAQRFAGEPPHLAAQEPPSVALVSDLAGTLSPTLVFEETLRRVEAGQVGWCAPEVLRLHGERLLARAGPTEAEPMFQTAFALALAQKALSWQLRIACSMARMHRDGPQAAASLQRVDTLLRTFRGGRDTADLQSARELVDTGQDG